MNTEQAIHDSLTSAAPGTPIYPLLIDDGASFPLAQPVITYQLVSAVFDPTYDCGSTRNRVQVDCWASTYSAAVSLRSKLRAALDGYTSNGATWQYLTSMDGFEHQSLTYRAMVEFYLHN